VHSSIWNASERFEEEVVKTSTSDGQHDSRNEPRMSVKPLETASFSGETEHHLFRLKSRAKFNDINVRFDSSCNVPVIEDQLLGAESKCDFRPRRRTSCIGAPQIPHGLVSLRAEAAPERGPPNAAIMGWPP
jgi:hypothetical protein